ncbi:hypothetical protein AAA088_09905 [Hominifimenecus microfluidus]|jgi:hypothetical protein|uniref:hypothetical protein n=1 Tax=Hominifimenecus microfluidus TaxID=2885348 RepID=UPI0032C0C72E
MKALRFDTLFLLAAVICALAADWSVPSCVLLLSASVYTLANVIPQLWRYYHESKKHQNQ